MRFTDQAKTMRQVADLLQAAQEREERLHRQLDEADVPSYRSSSFADVPLSLEERIQQLINDRATLQNRQNQEEVVTTLVQFAQMVGDTLENGRYGQFGALLKSALEIRKRYKR